QSVALFGHSGVARDSEDFFPAYLLNTILGGGGFESRLMTEVREKRGLTYGVYSFIVDKDHADMWMGQVQSANGRIADAIDVIRQQWAEIAENGVTEEELIAAKKYMTGAYPLRFDGNGPIANIITGMQIEKMPLDYPATRNDKVNAVTLEQVNDVARRYLRPDALRFVVVGQPEGLTSTN
ncbi:MAG: insulinase family protein, partial [Pseudomonadota bacterium]|nr:insulinase family protein [Pseudomonadota bacterium]